MNFETMATWRLVIGGIAVILILVGLSFWWRVTALGMLFISMIGGRKREKVIRRIK